MHVVIIVVCSIITACHAKPRQYKFVPYKGKVVSFYTEKYMYGGIHYQRVHLNHKTRLTANGFTANINGYKTNLIDYIAIGDSIVRDTWAEISVYREGSETYTFTHNPDDN